KRLSGHGLALSEWRRNFKRAQVHNLAGILEDIDTNNFAGLIEIQNNIRRDFPSIGRRPVRKSDIERVGILVIAEFHGRVDLKLLSGKAFSTVSPSSSVTTRRCLP